jgi:predicted metal-dependent peptidase
MIENKEKFDLNMHTARLLLSEPFFAALSRRINKTATTAIPTAGVRVTDAGQFEMLYNPEFFQSLPDVQRLGVLKHEFYHLIFEHVTSRKPEGENHMIWNFATDLAINSHLEGELPESCLMPGVGKFEDYPKELAAEAYLKLLKEDEQFGKDKSEGSKGEGEGEGEGDESGEGQDKNDSQDGEDSQASGSGSGQEQFDSHEGWGEGNSTANEIAKERLKDIVKKAAEEASKSNGWGSVSAQTRKDIIAKLQTFIDWKKVLRYFIKTSQRANKRSTVRKINRRFPYIHAGKKVQRQAQIAISIDQSGSVSDEMLAAFFAELNKLSKLATFIVIPFDTKVDPALVYKWKKGEHKKTERVMCGGTCFDAPTEYVNKEGFDGHIVLTDLMAPKPKASKCQRMWMTTKQHAQYPYFQTNERIIAIDVKA